MEVLRDDGVIVYLNGTEIFRDNMPAGAATYTTFAIAAVEPSAYLTTNLPASLLTTGNNVLAAEIHQADLTSSDISFDLSFSGLSVSNASTLQLAYISSPDNDQVFTSPANINITGNIESSSSPVSLVEFYGDNAKIGQVANSPYAVTWSNPSLGNHTVSLVATLQNGIQLTSAPVRIVVEAPMLPATSLTLIQTGAVWRYYANSAAPAGAWTTLNYNDTAWPSGAAELGYGEGDEVTIVPFGANSASKWITTYFRRVFTLNDPGAVTNLLLNLKRDDGAVVYLNGVEMLRDFMPAGAITWGTLANAIPDDGQIFNTFSLNPSSLLQGTNVLAVEIHQNAANSSDLSFDAALLATASSVRDRQIVLSSPTTGASIDLPANITLSADAVAGGSLTVSKVEFFDGNSRVGQDTSYPYTFTWNSPPAGTTS